MKTHSRPVPALTIASIEDARRTFLMQEPRNLFYRVALELIDLSLRSVTCISVAEALAVLLQTWNGTYYRFHGPFDEEHFAKIDSLITNNFFAIKGYRSRSIESILASEEDAIRLLFSRFEDVLGPVGAAKSLHLLAPSFFPLWDRAIAKGYGVKLDRGAFDEYLKFIRIVKEQCRVLEEQGATWTDPLKAIDECNYCNYTLKATVPH